MRIAVLARFFWPKSFAKRIEWPPRLATIAMAVKGAFQCKVFGQCAERKLGKGIPACRCSVQSVSRPGAWCQTDSGGLERGLVGVGQVPCRGWLRVCGMREVRQGRIQQEVLHGVGWRYHSYDCNGVVLLGYIYIYILVAYININIYIL